MRLSLVEVQTSETTKGCYMPIWVLVLYSHEVLRNSHCNGVSFIWNSMVPKIDSRVKISVPSVDRF
jgi:hypothetical protein